MRAPQIQQFESLEALITCVGDPAGFEHRLRLLKEAEDEINRKLVVATTVEQAESYLADAEAKLAEARDIRGRADGLIAETQRQVEDLLADARGRVDEMLAAAQGLADEAAAAHRDALEKTRQAELREAAARRAIERADACEAAARAEEGRAKALATELEERLARIRKAAGE